MPSISISTILGIITALLYGGQQLTQSVPSLRPLVSIALFCLLVWLIILAIKMIRLTPVHERGTVVSTAVLVGGFGTLGYILGFSSQYLLPVVATLLLQLDSVLIILHKKSIKRFYRWLYILGIVVSLYCAIYPELQINLAVYPGRTLAAGGAIGSALLYGIYTLYSQRKKLSEHSQVSTRTLMLVITVTIIFIYSPWRAYDSTLQIQWWQITLTILTLILAGIALMRLMTMRQTTMRQRSSPYWPMVGVGLLISQDVMRYGLSIYPLAQWLGIVGLLVCISWLTYRYTLDD